MKLYRFSPIMDETSLLAAIRHIHVAGNALCHQVLGTHLPNSGNMGVFCHYSEEYEVLKQLRVKLTEPSENLQQKYFRLHIPIVMPAEHGVPETTYTHLYIRQPDPYRHHVGDLDVYLAPHDYAALKQTLVSGQTMPGARVFPRPDLDMIELHHPDVDVLCYVSTKTMTEMVRVKT